MSSRYIKVHTVDEIRIVELSLPKTIDHVEFDKLNSAVVRVTDEDAADRWILDTAHNEYVGSAILGLMVNLRQRIKACGGKLVVCCLSDALAKALQTCSLHSLFVIVHTREDARKAVALLR